MKLTFLGSGSAFATDNYHSNLLLEGEKKLLIDCGSDIRFSLRDVEKSYKDIDAVYISHLHFDHIGGLEWLGFLRKFNYCENDAESLRPLLFGYEALLQDLWSRCLSGGMKCIEGMDASLETYFDLKPLSYPGSFEFDHICFELVKTDHVIDNQKKLDSYGLFFEINGTKIFFTTDAKFTYEQFLPYYEASDLIFHDCETKPCKSGVHATYENLNTLPMRFKSKMWLHGYDLKYTPDAVLDGFLGFIKRGQVFVF